METLSMISLLMTSSIPRSLESRMSPSTTTSLLSRSFTCCDRAAANNYNNTATIYLFIYYMVYTHVKSLTVTVNSRTCWKVTCHCRKARPLGADVIDCTSGYTIVTRGVDPYGTGGTRPPNIWTGGHYHECPPP